MVYLILSKGPFYETVLKLTIAEQTVISGLVACWILNIHGVEGSNKGRGASNQCKLLEQIVARSGAAYVNTRWRVGSDIFTPGAIHLLMPLPQQSNASVQKIC